MNAAASASTSIGSSPLARGLPSLGAQRLRDARIIPARAGFTPRHGYTTHPERDHPRSRGVYLIRRENKRFAAGSSPLARGLLSQGTLHSVTLGIIPARAGFTGTWNEWIASGTDHPRSRGVYAAVVPPTRKEPGSSPLARGLRRYCARVILCYRIIPARAGFTFYSPSAFFVSMDHPRSRGVYLMALLCLSWIGGSSPLARGLPCTITRSFRRLGIIPARAGFTLEHNGRGRVRRDHPRSRGVYHSTMTSRPYFLGSSPLARGLLALPCLSWIGWRIIPARAGFTRARPPSRCKG